MQPFILKYHRPGAPVPPAAFFLMARGPHTGRPATAPNPNCFVFICVPQDMTCYYWLVYGLWLTRQFSDILKGSCIEFACIEDVRELIAAKAAKLSNIEEKIGKLQKLQKLETQLRKQLALIQQVRQGLLNFG